MDKISIENIVKLFPTKTEDMPKISTPGTRPTYTSLRRFQDQLNTNAMTIPFPKTLLGHLGLVLPEDEYKTVNRGTAWTDPQEPAEDPDENGIFTRNSQPDQYQVQHAIRKWQRQTNLYTTFQLTREALKTQIIKSVDVEYINALKHKTTRFSQVTPLELLTHLWTNYGAIKVSDLRANEARMKAPWNPPTPIEELFNQLHEGQEFAETGGEEITESQLVRYGYDHIFDTGLFNDACTKWRNKDPTYHTWDNFKTFFTAKVNDYLQNTTAANAQYSAAQVREIVNDNIEAYAAATSGNPQATSTPPTDNPAPPEAANALTRADIKAIVTECLNQGSSTTNTSTSAKSNYSNNNSNSSNTKKSNKVRIAQGYNADGDPISYCWSHGITKNLNHTSVTCNRKKDGHKDQATLNNKMGGSEQVCEKRE